MEKGDVKHVRNVTFLVTWFKVPFYINARKRGEFQPLCAKPSISVTTFVLA